MNEKEIRKMEIIEYKRAFTYCWAAYNTRRVDLLIKAFSGEGGSGSGHRAMQGKGDKLLWDHPDIKNFINDNKSEEATIKDRLSNQMSYIPPRKG